MSRRKGRSRLTFGAVLAALLAVLGAVVGGGVGARRPGARGSGDGSSVATSRAPGGALPEAGGRAPAKKGGGAKAASTSRGAGADAPSVHLELGTPAGKGASDDLLLIKPQYALAYSRSRNVASWVSWNLDASYFGPAPRHKGNFLSDTTLPEGVYRARHEDYSGSGYDRGHMVRSEERTRTDEDNRATFLLTNILPQTHDLNAGPWLKLESYCQDLAQRADRELFLVAGGVFDARPQTIGKGIAVPGACFKVVVVLERGQGAGDVDESTRVIAVVMPNTTGILGEDWGRYRTTVDDIEARTGYELLSRVPESVQAVIEARVDTGPTGRP